MRESERGGVARTWTVRAARRGAALIPLLAGAAGCTHPDSAPAPRFGALPDMPQSAYSAGTPGQSSSAPVVDSSAAAPPGVASGCQVDGDCKGNRVCSAGRCVSSGSSPTPAAGSAPVSPPVVSAPGPSFVSGSPQPTAYAIVIGVEKYSAALPPPTGAHADARRFSDLVRTSLGVSPDHVQTLFDEQATKGSIERALAATQAAVPAGGRIYFYFSGHGAPDPSAGASYIVPTDGDPQYLGQTAIAMKEVLTTLSQSKAREVLAVVDSCFSGAGGRSVLPPGARPIVRVKEEAAPAQLALFSASNGNEISGPTASGDGGLFTQYVLQGLGTGAADMNGDGQVSLGELSQWVGPRVSREAKKANRDQNPALTVGKGLGSADSFIVEWGLAAK
jgi:hypothetical protein